MAIFDRKGAGHHKHAKISHKHYEPQKTKIQICVNKQTTTTVHCSGMKGVVFNHVAWYLKSLYACITISV
jgi:hypothetical protein